MKINFKCRGWDVTLHEILHIYALDYVSIIFQIVAHMLRIGISMREESFFSNQIVVYVPPLIISQRTTQSEN